MRGGPEFHAEWLRDEPCDATATDPGSYIPGAWCQLSPGNREHGIRQAHNICIRFPIASFPFFLEKEAFAFWGAFSRLVVSYSLVWKRSKRAIVASRRTRRFARIAQILRETKNVSLRMTSPKRKRVAHVELRTAVPGMRTELGKPASVHLRRLFLSSGSCLRLRRDQGAEWPGNF